MDEREDAGLAIGRVAVEREVTFESRLFYWFTAPQVQLCPRVCFIGCGGDIEDSRLPQKVLGSIPATSKTFFKRTCCSRFVWCQGLLLK